MIFKTDSQHFDFHPTIESATYADALAAAKKRGFEARITCDGVLVATWSALYGVHTYDRALAGMAPALDLSVAK